jgi:hypothetical protein
MKGYGVTIIVEGGLGSLEVLENDIESQRPTVLIQVCIIYSYSLISIVLQLFKYRVAAV